MSYQVVWSDEALDNLAAIWMQAADRSAVNASQNKIDELLRRDPWNNGSAVREGLFALDVPPLRGVYEISDADLRVSVVAINILK
ncbi:MAG: type II toxin-antitoxin system RelE/ParE family toxin [Gemmataceae bacterium]|nr:type II toxin-antitoxin system RelE/ParE family toxin [Gemmataceae bacterium]